MFKKLIGFIGDSNDKQLKKLWPLVERVNSLEREVEALSDADLRARTEEFRARLAAGESLDDLLPEAFAAVREASRRTIGLRHFDVQIMGGVVLHQGKIAEMKTGEGKTLVATLPLYLNALAGGGVHLVTVNDYLAKRDTQWMGPIYHALGVTVGCLQHEASYVYDPSYEQENPSLAKLRPVSRQEAYRADITYGTNNEFGFDYLRDNMVGDLSQRVQREPHYAIVDEVDNILIDEARTPLIISGPAEESTKLYYTFAALARQLRHEEDYTIEEKERSVRWTPEGQARVVKRLGVDPWGAKPEEFDEAQRLLYFLDSAVKAHAIFKRDKDYVVRDGEVIIVDEFTGRLMLGRRYSDGLHQAIEAKEGVAVQRESVTYATITLQNLFRLYPKLAGMTGTAATDAEELWKIYKLDVVVIPTHQPMIREDHTDFLYKTEDAKFRAVARDIEERHKRGQPVLVGTVSIEKSEKLSEMLERRGIPHQVLNAKFHEKEAVIVAQAGRPGAVTVATNMAGRGTDIVLGGDPSTAESQEHWQRDHETVVALGGLHIIGTDRHEARRIDNQLRGRAGRQGDPGSSRFYISLEDDLMRRFGGDRIKWFLSLFRFGEDTPLESGSLNKAMGSIQGRVEAYNFDIRKNLVEYDDVINTHRDVIYTDRRKALGGADLKANVQGMVDRELDAVAHEYLVGEPDQWDLDAFLAELQTIFPLPQDFTKMDLEFMSREEIAQRLHEHARELYEQREREFGAEQMRILERLVMLRVIDSHWVHHLTAMSDLRQGIGLHGVSQRNPLVEYKIEGSRQFDALLARIQQDIAHTIYRVAPVARAPSAQAPSHQDNQQQAEPQQARVSLQASTVMSKALGRPRGELVPAGGRKVGRNDPCPCGSGKKYKKCHGTAA